MKLQKEVKRILFFHQGRISDWAGAVLGGLSREFPTAQILRFDLHSLLKQRPVLMSMNGAATLHHYWQELLRGKIELDDAFFTTPYLFKQIQNLSSQIHQANPADFSFQMHSMHDHSCPAVPHFVYTDFTYHNCRDYAGYGHAAWAPVRPPWLLDLEQIIYDRATGIFAQSQYVQSTIVAKYGIPQQKVLNVRYGPNVDQDLLRKLPINQARYRSKRIIFVGGQWDRKGGPELVHAFDEVRKVCQDAKLIVAGCSPNISNPAVEIVGKLPFQDLAQQYGKASVFCMPSKLEPSASVYVEAMSSGLPVVALNTGAVRELVTNGRNGFLIESNNRPQLANVLTNLLASPEQMLQLGLNARASVEKDYNWNSVFRQVGQYIRAHSHAT